MAYSTHSKRLGSWATVSTLFTALGRADSGLVNSVSKDNSEQCGCFLVSGVDPGYFAYHRFWDFRNIASESNNDFTVAPALLTAEQNQGNEGKTSAYLSSSEFQTDWTIHGGPARPSAPIPAFDSAQNVYISRNTSTGVNNSTYLALRVQRLETFASTAEIDLNQKNIRYSSIRGRFRIIPNSLDNSAAPAANVRSLIDSNAGSNISHPIDNGAVFGFFTYHSDTQESDIEILTNDATGDIRYSNQPDYNAETDETVPGASTQITMPDGLVWTEWQEHRVDWFDGISRWYVNDQHILDKQVNVPTTPSGFIMNLWTDGGSWSGNMSVGSTVLVGVEWVEMVFNVSGKNEKRQGTACHIGCIVDSVQRVGYPEVAFNSSTSAAAPSCSENRSVVYSYIVVLAALLVAII